jgi:Carboxypeptidase regulatory-like domain
MKKKKRKRKKKRIGISILLGAVLLAAFVPLTAAPKKKPALETYALVSGSVFEDNGYALGGADVTVVQETPGGETPKASANKTKPAAVVSDARGEFVVRVPPGPAKYTVTAHAKGFKSGQKTVSVQDQERVEVTFQLERESK